MKKNRQKGIALFIAVIAVSALLLISLAVSDIAYKEQVLSYAGRDSKIAFYAADTGLECALFHDLKVPDFFPVPGSVGEPSPLVCQGQVTADPVRTDNNEEESVTTRFWFSLIGLSGGSERACAIVEVKKMTAAQGIDTTVTARGYNSTCDSSGELDPNIRNLERALEVTY